MRETRRNYVAMIASSIMSLYLVRLQLITVLISSWMCITAASREQSFSVFVMKGYGGSGSIAPLILNLDTMWMRVVKLRHGILWILFNEIYSNIFFTLPLFVLDPLQQWATAVQARRVPPEGAGWSTHTFFGRGLQPDKQQWVNYCYLTDLHFTVQLFET